MNTWIKRLAAAAGVTTALVLPIAGQASDGTITFTGAITANTCTVQVNGGGTGDGTVILPTVDMAALTNATADKTTAAGTFFSIGLSDCTIPIVADTAVTPTNVQIYFEAGPNVNPLTGGLINTVTVAASNVEVNLYNASSAGAIVTTQIMPGTTTQPVAQLIVADPDPKWFYAGYSTAGADAAASAGAVSTSVTYSLVYS